MRGTIAARTSKEACIIIAGNIWNLGVGARARWIRCGFFGSRGPADYLGKVFEYFNLTWSYLISLFIFELGSLICAVVPSRTALIIGRAIASIGRAGLGLYRALWYYRLSGKSRTERQSAFMGVMGATYALTSFVGRLLGGASTENVIWRRCFYFNLPISERGRNIDRVYSAVYHVRGERMVIRRGGIGCVLPIDAAQDPRRLRRRLLQLDSELF